ncbi:MAG: hypothetical protein E4G98_03465 [Promethearchaeota archaeon]|nr:MAG: hypothetical protein E4G98_03465 [Candidatus Lokiarchaeota archaeon]
MVIKSMFFLPHGMQIIPGLETPYNHNFGSLHAAMQKIQQRISAEDPDLIILFTPHGYRLESAFCLYLAKTYRAFLPKLDRSNVDGTSVHSIEEYPTNWDFLNNVLKTYKNHPNPGFELESLSLATPEYPLPLAWGSSVPLHYTRNLKNYVSPQNTPQQASKQGSPEIAIISLPNSRRNIKKSRDSLHQCGKFFGHIIQESSLKISVVFSGDLAHTHQNQGNFSLHPSSKIFDDKIQDWIKNLDKTHWITPDLIQLEQTALACGLSTLLIMEGMLDYFRDCFPHISWKSDVIDYTVPTYFGMLIVHIFPKSANSV